MKQWLEPWFWSLEAWSFSGQGCAWLIFVSKPLYTGCYLITSVMSDSAAPWTVAHRSSVDGIFQARILEWVAIPSSRGSSWPRCWSWVSYISCFGRQVVYHYHHLGTWEGISIYKYVYMNKLWSERRLQRGGLKYFHIFFEMFPFKRWMQILLLHSC